MHCPIVELDSVETYGLKPVALQRIDRGRGGQLIQRCSDLRHQRRNRLIGCRALGRRYHVLAELDQRSARGEVGDHAAIA